MGGPSGPTLSAQIAAIRDQSVGPEGPPTKTSGPQHRAGPVAQPNRSRTSASRGIAAAAPLRSVDKPAKRTA
ncbi:DUF6053 domain-containing protein [Lysobacter enzymogenes]|uniref:DUF6053 domain-containing protein n=1 Tax=Lysobacter enzymogenes TaxID=69 RepID=UPI003D18BA88